MGVDGRGKANTENHRNGNYKSKILPKKEQKEDSSKMFALIWEYIFPH